MSLSVEQIKEIVDRVAKAEDVTEIGPDLATITDTFVDYASEIERLTTDNARLIDDNNRIREINGNLMMKVGEKLEVEKPEDTPPAKDEKTPDEVIEELKEEDFSMSSKKMTESAKAQKTLNAVRSMMSESAQADIPVLAEGDDISKFANPILNYKAHTNEFISVLVDRIMFTAVEVKRYTNRLARLKKGRPYPLGTDVQQTYENPVNPMGYNGENLSGILKLYKGDTKVAYYTRNRQDVFPLSINREELMGAFVSYEKFNRFVSAKINAVFSGNEIREFNLFKQAIVDAYANNIVLGRKMVMPATKDEAEDMVATIRETAMNMTFPSTAYNNYINQPGAVGDPVETWSEADRIVIIIRSDLINKLGVKVLAMAFNMAEADFRNNLIVVDSFDYDNYDLENRKRTGKTLSDIGFVICDEALFQVYDNIQTAAEDFIGSSLTWQYFFHVWQIYGICPFANAMVFEVPKADALQDLTITDFHNPSGENFVELKAADATQTVDYATIPVDYKVNNMRLEFEQVLESAAKDKITAETLAEYVTITFDSTAKTITFTGHSTADTTHTATVLCNIIADGVATPVAVVVNFTI